VLIISQIKFKSLMSVDIPHKLNCSLLLKKLLMLSFQSSCIFPFIINDLCNSLDCGNYHLRLIRLLFIGVLLKWTLISKTGLISCICRIMKPFIKIQLDAIYFISSMTANGKGSWSNYYVLDILRSWRKKRVWANFGSLSPD
jgi:hypothetical protein